MILSVAFWLQPAADAIQGAVKKAIASGYRTGDIYTAGSKKVNTKEMGDAILSFI